MIRSILLTLILTTVSAPLIGHLDVGIDAIYWKGYGGGFFIANITTRNEDTPLQVENLVYLRPDFGWGPRVYANYCSPCLPLTLAAEYSTFEGRGRFDFVLSDEQVASGPGIDLTSGGDTATGKGQLRQHAVDLFGGRNYTPCRNLCVSMEGGLHYLYLDSRATTETVRTDLRGTNKTQTNYSGAGPLARVQIRTKLKQCIWAQAKFLGGACVGSRDFARSVLVIRPSTGEIEEDTITSERTTALIPVAGVDLNLSLRVPVCAFCVGAEVGYRARSYFDLHDGAFFSDRLQTVSVAGPYFGLTATF